MCEGICERIRNGRESPSSSCSPALRGSRSARGQPQGQPGPPPPPPPPPLSSSPRFCEPRGRGSQPSRALRLRVCVCPILSGARMRMRELSLRQDPDLRKELALLARGCDFVLPSRFKKRLRAFQQGQAGFSAALGAVRAALSYSNSECWFFKKKRSAAETLSTRTRRFLSPGPCSNPPPPAAH